MPLDDVSDDAKVVRGTATGCGWTGKGGKGADDDDNDDAGTTAAAAPGRDAGNMGLRGRCSSFIVPLLLLLLLLGIFSPAHSDRSALDAAPYCAARIA